MAAAAFLSPIFEPGFFSSEPVHVAVIVGGIAAVVSAVVGVFTVIRGQSFAGHALADIGSAGGSAAVLVGASTLYGFVAFNVVAAGVMELIGIRKPRGRDLATGIVLGASLGLAALFLYEDTLSSSTTGATVNVLFGSIFTLPPGITPVIAGLGVTAVGLVALLYRPLLLSSVSYDLAAARPRPRPSGGRRLPPGSGPGCVVVRGHHWRHPVDRSADRTGRHCPAGGVPHRGRRGHRVRGRGGGLLGRDPGRLRQHRLDGRARLAGQLLHCGHHFHPLYGGRGRGPAQPAPAAGKCRGPSNGGRAGRGGLMFANFMVNAWEAATLVAIVAGVVGFFTVLPAPLSPLTRFPTAPSPVPRARC